MKKVYLLFIAFLLTIVVTNAQTLVFEETFDDWADGVGIQNDENWIGVGNTNGWIANGNGLVIPPAGWRGGTQSGNPLSGWIPGEKVRITVDLGVDFSAEVGDPIEKRLKTRIFGNFGLTTNVDVTGGQNGTTASTYVESTLGFRFEQNQWTGNPVGSIPSGSLKFFPYFGSTNNTDAYIPGIEDMGANIQGLTADGVATADIPASNDLVSDVIRVSYYVMKEATAGEFTVDVVVENLTTSISQAKGPFTVLNTEIYNATDVYFTASTQNGGPFVFMDNVKLEKGIPLALGDDIKSGESKIFLVGNTLYVKDVESTMTQFKVYNLSGVAVAEGEFSGSSYSETLNLDKGVYMVKIGSKATKIMIQ
ncbi:T9SS type A sorting domain-containing protein [Saccharicrinis sp. 156]|uniref:T9SS type A sorting domain-containing protein n=1 Tax=Saccharicrinis sp. 156 TaxID=3417574 RepID=UPI003D358AED